MKKTVRVHLGRLSGWPKRQRQKTGNLLKTITCNADRDLLSAIQILRTGDHLFTPLALNRWQSVRCLGMSAVFLDRPQDKLAEIAVVSCRNSTGSLRTTANSNQAQQ